jgi:tetratricopeptide (TPR) repeat protein
MLKLFKNLCLFVLVFFLTGTLLILLISSTANTAQAQIKSVCATQLNDAEQKYNTGRFDEAIGLITKCLGKPEISEQEKMRAYRLLGLSYIAKDYLEDARTAVKKLLDMVPNYQSDPVQDPPPFTKMVEEIKEQQQPSQPEIEEPEIKRPDEVEEQTQTEPKKGGSKKWYYIGGGAAVTAGIVAAVLLWPKEEKSSSLPGPPSLP